MAACEDERIDRAKSAHLDLDAKVEGVATARTFVATMLDLWECNDPAHVADLLTS